MPKGAVKGRGRQEDGTAGDLVSFAEIARELGVTAQCIEKSYHNAIRKIKDNPDCQNLLEYLRDEND